MLVLCLVLFGVSVSQGSPKDSYLEAYQASHGVTSKADREYTEPYPYPPSQPGGQYGPPKVIYGPPAHNYGPPAPVYGPPTAPVYGPPAPIYGTPHALLGLLDKLKFKLDLFTFGKILLKIVLFKKFVSFVAILCLLLFIPYLKNKVDDGMPDGGDDDEAMRGLGPKKYKAGDEFLNNITQFVVGAIDSFSQKYEDKECQGVYCKTKKIVDGIDNKINYKKLMEMYSRGILLK